MAANSSLLNSICNLLLAWTALRDPRDHAFQWTLMFDFTLSPGKASDRYSGVFRKLQDTVTRVHIFQVIKYLTPSCRTRSMIEVLHRAWFKFPGCQKIHVSKKWGFTKFNADEFEAMAAEMWLILGAFGVKYIPSHDPIAEWWALHS